MLAYPIPEAEALLNSKLEAAQSSLDNCEEDLDFLREQITVGGARSDRGEPCYRSIRTTDRRQTMEVATARVYNWDVGQRRKDKAGGEADGGKGTKGGPDG